MKDLKDLRDLVEDCAVKFIDCMRFYNFVPKKGKLENATPEDFFCIWYPFCSDYKNLWKKEQVRIQKELLKEERRQLQKKKESLKEGVEVKKTPAGGLKDKLLKRKSKASAGAAPEDLNEIRRTHNSDGGDTPKTGVWRRESKRSEAALETLAEVEQEKPRSLKDKMKQRKARQEASERPAEEQDEY